MTNAIKSVAILKASIDEHKDVVDNYVPFISNMAVDRSYHTVDVPTILRDFGADYGLQVPYHAMIAILSRCKDRGIVGIDDLGQYHFDLKGAKKHAFAASSRDVLQNIDRLIQEFRAFAEVDFKIAYSTDQVVAIIVAFLRDYDAELVLSRKDASFLPDIDLAVQDAYVFHKYVLHIYKDNPASYKILVELAVGYLYASSVLFTQLKPSESKVRDVRMIFDTRLLLRLIGLEGEERAAVYTSLLESFKKDGARLKVYNHTIEEIEGILDDCAHWVENPKYKAVFAGPALRHFVENRYSVSDVLLFAASLESCLSRYGIRPTNGNFSFGLVKDFIDEPALYNTIVQEYSKNSDTFRECAKREVLYRDVKSLSAITRLREGAFPKSLRRASAIFVTTNSALARAAGKFFGCESGRNHVCECVTDTYLGTVVWLSSPSTIEGLQYKKILADSVAALRPDEELIEKYRSELDKLKERKEISEREYFFMRSHPKPLSRLQDKTFGDPDAFMDKLPEEILQELKAEIAEDVRKDSEATIQEKSRELAILSEQLDKTQKERAEMSDAIETTTRRLDRLAAAVTMAIAVLLSIALLFLSIMTILPPQKLLWKLVFGLPTVLLSALNIVFGFSVIGYYPRLRRWISSKLRKAFGLD